MLREHNRAIVRLKDVADVDLGAEDYDTDVRFYGQKATFIGVWVLPTANSLDVIKAVRAEIPAIAQNLPAGMKSASRTTRPTTSRTRLRKCTARSARRC